MMAPYDARIRIRKLPSPSFEPSIQDDLTHEGVGARPALHHVPGRHVQTGLTHLLGPLRCLALEVGRGLPDVVHPCQPDHKRLCSSIVPTNSIGDKAPLRSGKPFSPETMTHPCRVVHMHIKGQPLASLLVHSIHAGLTPQHACLSAQLNHGHLHKLDPMTPNPRASRSACTRLSIRRDSSPTQITDFQHMHSLHTRDVCIRQRQTRSFLWSRVESNPPKRDCKIDACQYIHPPPSDP